MMNAPLRLGTRPVGAAQLAVKDTSTDGPVFAATPIPRVTARGPKTGAAVCVLITYPRRRRPRRPPWPRLSTYLLSEINGDSGPATGFVKTCKTSVENERDLVIHSIIQAPALRGSSQTPRSPPHYAPTGKLS